jgi:hypothetical protein
MIKKTIKGILTHNEPLNDIKLLKKQSLRIEIYNTIMLA